MPHLAAHLWTEGPPPAAAACRYHPPFVTDLEGHGGIGVVRTLATARGAAGTNEPVADLEHTPGEVVCVSLFSVCAVSVLL